MATRRLQCHSTHLKNTTIYLAWSLLSDATTTQVNIQVSKFVSFVVHLIMLVLNVLCPSTRHTDLPRLLCGFGHLLILSHLSLECVHINLFSTDGPTQLHCTKITNLVRQGLKSGNGHLLTQFFITQQLLLSTTNECLSWYRPHVLQDRKTGCNWLCHQLVPFGKHNCALLNCFKGLLLLLFIILTATIVKLNIDLLVLF